MRQQKTGTVILGAGFSTRFGADKRLHQLDGCSVAETTIKTYLKAFKNIRIVLRPEDDELANLLETFDVELLRSKNAVSGMGHSLSDGITNLDWQWAFIALLDMPFIKPETLRSLINSAEKANPQTHRIVRARLNSNPSQTAHPIGFHNSLFSELSNCSGDTGAKPIIRKYSSEIFDVEFEDLGLCQDIDRPTDLKKKT